MTALVALEALAVDCIPMVEGKINICPTCCSMNHLLEVLDLERSYSLTLLTWCLCCSAKLDHHGFLTCPGAFDCGDGDDDDEGAVRYGFFQASWYGPVVVAFRILDKLSKSLGNLVGPSSK